MLKVLAERRALSASNYLRQLLRKEFRLESEKWRQTLTPLERAILGELADAGAPEEVGEIHAGLDPDRGSQDDVARAVRRLRDAGLVQKASRAPSQVMITLTGCLVIGRS